MLAERMSRISASPTMKVAARGGEAAAPGHRRRRLRRRRARFPDAGAGEGRGQARHRPELHEIHAGGRHRRPEAGDLRALPSRLRRELTPRPKSSSTAGGKQALYNTALALFGPGDEVITHAPYWPTIPEQIKLADASAGDRADQRRRTASRFTPRRSSRRSRRARRRSSSTRRATRPAR